MKKLLIFTVICLCFAACGSDDGDKTPPFPGQTSITEVTQKIMNSSSGQTANDPVELNVKINASEWAQLFPAINSSGKFVSLDISSCYNVPQIFNSIGSYAAKVVSIILPENITWIAANCFKDCANLRRIVLPSSVTGIAQYAFENCTSLERIICRAKVPPTTSGQTFSSAPSTTIIEVPASSLQAYKSNWGENRPIVASQNF